MDACIDTEAIVEGIDSISNIIENISECIAFMNNKLTLASDEFTSINFERTSNSVDKAVDALLKMNAKLDLAKTYLDKLVNHIEAYNKLRY